MAEASPSFLARFLHRRVLRRWRALAEAAPALPPARLTALAARARPLHFALGRLLAEAARQGLPARPAPCPPGADWAERPAAFAAPLPGQPGLCPLPKGAAFGPGLQIFHDGAAEDFALRQTAPPRAGAPYGLVIDIWARNLPFLALALDLPPGATTGLSAQHLLQLHHQIETRDPLRAYARLNLHLGPNQDHQLLDLPLHPGQSPLTFDLAPFALDKNTLHRAWIDLIFENPALTQIHLHDLWLARRPRAGF